MTKKPLVVRGLALVAGYLWAAMHRAERPVSPELRAFRRKEQMNHLANVLIRKGTRRERVTQTVPAKVPH